MPTKLQNTLKAAIQKTMKAKGSTRKEVIAAMAKSARIQPDTVVDILAGRIKQPPQRRLDCFARVLSPAKKQPAKKKANSKKANGTATGPVRPNKTRKISQGCRAYYKGDRSKIPLRNFLEKDRDYPYRTTAGRIDCNMVSAAIKRARLNKGQPGAAAVLKKAQAIWNRVCRKYTDDASQ